MALASCLWRYQPSPLSKKQWFDPNNCFYIHWLVTLGQFWGLLSTACHFSEDHVHVDMKSRNMHTIMGRWSSPKTTRAMELAWCLDLGINRVRWSPVRTNGSNPYSLWEFAWWTCDIRTQTLSEMSRWIALIPQGNCLANWCQGWSTRRSSSRIIHHTWQSPSSYVPTVLFVPTESGDLHLSSSACFY